MEQQTCNFNISYDLPDDIWTQVPLIYQRMNGWLGFGNGFKGEKGIPY